MKKKLIIFDLDGVLFDSTPVVREFFLTEYPTMTKEILAELCRGNFHEELEKFKLTNARLEGTEEEKEARSVAYANKRLYTPLFDGIKELLLDLHTKGYILTINSSAKGKNCLPVLENSGVLGLFDFVGSADMSKSKVEKFKIIEEKYKMSKEETIFITDTIGDLREADIAGVPTVAVMWGVHDRALFSGEGSKHLVAIFDSVPELHDFLLK